jgi:C4-dicarboxylate-specific signal transduction histidine kinase
MTSSKGKTESTIMTDAPEDPEAKGTYSDSLKRQLSAHKDLILIGKLTPEVVHDINNYLTGILGYAELLSMKPIQDEGVKRGLKNITLSAEKCRELLSHLSGLIRQERSLASQGNINEAVEKAVLLRQCALRHKQITLEKSLGDNLTVNSGFGVNLEKALLALIFYIEDVLEKKEKDRKITIETGSKGFDRIIIRLHVFAEEEAFSALLKHMMEEKDAVPEDCLLGVGLLEALDWIKTLGGTLETERMAEGGFSFLIHLPTKSEKAFA